MAETGTSTEQLPPIENIRENQKYGVELCEKLARFIHLPVSGEQLFSAFEEIFTVRTSKITLSDKKDRPPIDDHIEQLQEITEKKSAWHELLEDYLVDPGMSLEHLDIRLKRSGSSLSQIVFDTLELGLKKEEAYQALSALDEFHLPRTAALWSSIAVEVGQEYGEDLLERENLNRILYSPRFARVYGRLLDPVRVSARIALAGREFSRDLRAARNIVTQAQPTVDAELAKKGFNEAARKKLYGRAVVFLAENPVGQKIANMVDVTAKSSVGKSAGSVFSGMQEGFISPLCAVMLVASIEDAPDKEKALIQYFTFLFAGQLAQEGAKPFGNMLVKFLEKMAPKGDAKLAKLTRYLMSDFPKTKFAILVASVAVVVGVFQWEPAKNIVSDMAEWIDNSIDHGAFREDTANALELVAMAASWELTLGFKLGSEIMGLNGVNPFNDQLDFLEKHPGKEGIEAWNKRVSEVQRGGVADVLSTGNGPLQMTILEQQKITSPEAWAEQNIIPFQLSVSDFDMTYAPLMELLATLPVSPNSPDTLLRQGETIRHREYALSETDVWTERGDIIDDGSGFVGMNQFSGDGNQPNDRYSRMALHDRVNFPKYGGRLMGKNAKAIQWLEDVKGTPEDRVDEFFENLDGLIAREKAKCQRERFPGIGRNMYYAGQFELDETAYKKIEPWITRVQEAKKQWVEMRFKALEIARQVTVARSLGVYNQSEWSRPFDESGSLAFRGLWGKVARDYQLREMTTPTTSDQACAIIDAAGSGIRMYGDDILDGEWRKKSAEEYKKWTERNGLGIDDREIHTDRLKQLIRGVYDAGIPPEYIARTLEPIAYIARHQGEGQYVTPDIVSEIEKTLGRLLLDQAFRDAVKSGGTSETIREVRYTCPGYLFIRTYTPDKEGITIADAIETLSYQALPGGEGRLQIVSKRPLSPSRKETSEVFERRILREQQRQQRALEIQKNRAKTKELYKQQKTLHRGDNPSLFEEYYDSSELSGGKWTKISEGNTLPILYVLHRSGAVLGSPPQHIGWSWKTPDFFHGIRAVAYFGPGIISEVSCERLGDFSRYDAQKKDVIRRVLTSPIGENPLRTLLLLTDRSVFIDTVRFDGFESLGATRDLALELEQKLTPLFEKANDKKAFLEKTLDVLLTYSEGISGKNFDSIVKKIQG